MMQTSAQVDVGCMRTHFWEAWALFRMEIIRWGQRLSEKTPLFACLQETGDSLLCAVGCLFQWLIASSHRAETIRRWFESFLQDFFHQARTFFIPTGDKGRQEAFRVFLQLQNYWGVTQLQSLGQSMHAHTHTQCRLTAPNLALLFAWHCLTA